MRHFLTNWIPTDIGQGKGKGRARIRYWDKCLKQIVTMDVLLDSDNDSDDDCFCDDFANSTDVISVHNNDNRDKFDDNIDNDDYDNVQQ